MAARRMKSYKSEAGFAYLRTWIQMERKFEICNVSFEEVLKIYLREKHEKSGSIQDLPSGNCGS